MTFQEEFDAIVARYNQQRSEKTRELMLVVQKLKTDEEQELEALRAKYNRPPSSKTDWTIRCEEFDIEFELPGYARTPHAIPGIDYYHTHLNVAGHAHAHIVKALRKRGVTTDFFTWTQTSPRGKTETWSDERLYRESAFERAAG